MEQTNLLINPEPIQLQSGAAHNDSLALELSEQEIRQKVRTLLGGFQSNRKINVVERRRSRRYAYPYPIYLTAVGDNDVTPEGEPIVVLGKYLSECGLDFYHREPLPYRRMIISIECDEELWISLLMDLTWCRFNRHGWYDNGGRFLHATDLPKGVSEKAAIKCEDTALASR